MGNIVEKIKGWFRLGKVDPVEDEKLIWKIILLTERGAILVVAIVSGIAVAAYGYLLASGYTSWEWVRWGSAISFFALATAITDVGVKYFIQKGAYDLFAALNPSTYRGVKLKWSDLIIIASAIVLTTVCYFTTNISVSINVICKLNKIIYAADWLKCLSLVLLLCVFIPISETAVKSFMDTPNSGKFSWFQRAMQVIGWFVMAGLVFGMFYFDYISTDSVRRPVANMVKKERKLNQDSIRQIVIAQENARVGAVVEAIAAINADIRATQRQIERAKEQAGAANMKKLAATGNGWAKQQIKIAQAKAAKPYEAQLQQQLQTKQELNDQRVRDLAYQSAMVAKSDSSVLATNAGIEGRNESLVEGTSTMFIWLGFWAKCIAGGLRILLVILFLASTPKDFNGDGKTDFRDVTPAAEKGFLAG